MDGYTILQKLKEYNDGLDRDTLADKLKTPRTTVYDHLIRLMKKGLVRSFKHYTGRIGRPLVIWECTEKT